MTTAIQEVPWWADHQNLALVANYMGSEEGDDVSDIIEMLNKPWHYDDEFAKARNWMAAQQDG